MCLRALPAALQVDSFLLFNLAVGKARETGERSRGVGNGKLGGLVLPRLALAPLPVLGLGTQSQRDHPVQGQHLISVPWELKVRETWSNSVLS